MAFEPTLDHGLVAPTLIAKKLIKLGGAIA